MKNIIPILSATLLIATSCSQNTRTGTAEGKSDSVAAPVADHMVPQPLFAVMKINETIKVGDSVKLKFTVYNTADTAQHFCKWHTPFEPLISKYLDIKDDKGEEASYKGAMAKRVMPPPADSYVKVNPGDSLSVDVDVLKGYAISKPGKYSISYNAQGMSGLIVKDSIAFNYVKP